MLNNRKKTINPTPLLPNRTLEGGVFCSQNSKNGTVPERGLSQFFAARTATI
jgi:hypothetical protein